MMAVKNYAENWIDEYKSKLGSIKFTDGDYNTLKDAIRSYVVKQNPEGFNAWQESSEVGMFVNAIAYLGENINYRVDLNVTDLFPSTTNRKQSLLNFTKMLSYASKRNMCANGLAKLVSVSTTQDIHDTSGNFLKGVTIKWNDKSNANWLEQFLTILNNAFTYTNQFGKPLKKISINNISNQLYQVNSITNQSSVYPFTATVSNSRWNFEVVNPDIDTYEKSIVELAPIPENAFQLLYRNDGAGNSSINTGFFVHWKQGVLTNRLYEFDEKIEHNILNIDVENINNNDVWLQELDATDNFVKSTWTQIPVNEELSYTSTDIGIRTIYKVETRENDQITLKFPDGYFGDIPYGLYRLWYRTSNGNNGIYIKPSDISNISIQIPYYNNKNNDETNVYYLTLTFSVADVSHIRQAVPTESMESIRNNASDIYSTQNRMVSAKDYNYFPKSIGQQLKVLKSTLRTYSGNSRFIDLNDPTGTYSPVNVLATDGYIYSQTDCVQTSTPIGYSTADVMYSKYIEPKLSLKEILNLYYHNYDGNMIPEDDNMYYYWKPSSVKLGINTMVGGFNKFDKSESYKNDSNKSFDDFVGDINVGDLLCFQEYTINGIIETEIDNIVWARVENINEEKREVSISEVLDVNKKWKIRKGISGSSNWSKFSNFITAIDSEVRQTIIDMLNSGGNQTTFGITYVPNAYGNGKWFVIDFKDYEKYNTDELLMIPLTSVGGSENINVMNWIFRVTYSTETNSLIFENRSLKIIFGSEKEVSFFFNTSQKDGSNSNYFLTKDTIKIVSENNDLNKDYYWKPYDVIKYADGYVDTQEFCCEAHDGDSDNVIDVPTQYDIITKNQNNIIFMNGLDDESQKTVIKHIDLSSDYNNFGKTEDERGFNSSLWQRTNTPGYYYTYHKINELIPAGTSPIKNKNKELLYPNHSNVILSNGMITSFAGEKETAFVEQRVLDYDFVDYIKEYDNFGEPIFYDDIINVTPHINDKPNQIFTLDGKDVYDSQNKCIGFVISVKDGSIIYDINNKETQIGHINVSTKTGYLYYLKIENGIKTLVEYSSDDYSIVKGRSDLTFLWKHHPSEDYIVDPCSTNIIDMFVLTNDYYNEVQTWIQNGKKGTFPKAPSSYELKGIFNSLETNKMISDNIVWHPVTYKLLFGQNADSDTHCVFKIIKKNELITDNEVKKQVIYLIDKFFNSMGVGETFYFTQLSTYIENQIPELIKTCLIVPTDTTNKFGKLFQIVCGENEILLSSATLEDVQIISTITDKNIRII